MPSLLTLSPIDVGFATASLTLPWNEAFAGGLTQMSFSPLKDLLRDPTFVHFQ